jgi:Spy/CpxP family protein refolding chaperone
MNLTKPTTKTVAFSSALLLSLFLAAGAGHAARRPAASSTTGGLGRRIVQRLDLTPEQVQDIRTIFGAHKEELTSELDRVQAAHAHLFDTIHAETYDEAAIRAASAQVGKAESDLAVTRGKLVTEIRQVLTPEQRAEAKKMLGDTRSFVEGLIDRFRERLESDPLG